MYYFVLLVFSVFHLAAPATKVKVLSAPHAFASAVHLLVFLDPFESIHDLYATHKREMEQLASVHNNLEFPIVPSDAREGGVEGQEDDYGEADEEGGADDLDDIKAGMKGGVPAADQQLMSLP